MAKAKNDKIYDLTINVKRPSIFSSFNFPNYIDEHNVVRDLTDARGNVVVVGLTIGMIATRFDGTRPYDKKIIDWLLGHPLVKEGNRVSFTNISEQVDKSIDREIESAELVAKVIKLETVQARAICAVMNYSYNSDYNVMKAALIRAAKTYNEDMNSSFQKLRKAFENKDSKLHLDIKEFLEFKVMTFETGVYSFTTPDGESSIMGISTESCIAWLKDHTEVYAIMKQLTREAKKAK